MRTLLVDNHDSFTYNLFHYLAEVNGQDPTVIPNDQPGWRLADLAQFDNVVISPGPGTPHRDSDLGVCQEIIRHGEVPLLGVCLGHQALAYEAGAAVDRAPAPWHGRRSPVIHRGKGLFAGLPSPFKAVRYHSLAVTDLTEELEMDAWTPDGVVMGVRHLIRPMWGVQFHPESIRTEYGHQLLANFAELTRRAGRPTVRIAGHGATDAGATDAGATDASVCDRVDTGARRLRVLMDRVPTEWQDEVVFDRLFRDRPHAFWLDSSRTDDQLGRFSIMGDATGPLARVVTADAWRDTVTITAADHTHTVATRFLDWLEEDCRAIRVETPELPFDFTLGWVGYLGYELKSQCGADRVYQSPTPDAEMVFADRAVVLDHAARTTYLLALAEGDGEGDGEGDDAAARAWLLDTRTRLKAMAGTPAARTVPPIASRPVRLRHDRGRYQDLIKACLEEIAAGETYEVCLTNMIRVTGPIDVWASYRRLRRAHPVPFAALLQFGPTAVLSMSPERFLRVTADALIESKPIKGTRPRGASPEEDSRLRDELARDEKDRAENLMIVDLVRHDIGRVARVGSVHVHKLFDVESYAAVHQLVSTVRATLNADSSAVACLRAAFPGGSMTGAPKIRTMRIIDELEGGPRGVYSGAIGYLSLSGAADFNIVIRTLVVTPDRITYGVGGAIVAMSDPEAEYEETAVKAAPLLTLLDAEFPGRRTVVSADPN